MVAFLLLWGCGPISTAWGQKQANIWYFGYYTGLDFNTTPPTPLSGSMKTIEGCASIADRRSGELLFYTNGVTVWNRNHDTMSNGDGLLGHVSSTQSALIVPDPGDSLRYYIFTADASPYVPDPRMAGINYSTVDMRFSNGLGRVILKNVPLVRPGVEKLVGIMGCRGRDYWVIAHGWQNDEFYAFHVTEAGVSAPVISHVGRIQGASIPESERGYLKASPNGQKLAAALLGDTLFEVFNFDKSTGRVSASLSFAESSVYATSFSPDNSKLYLIPNLNTIVQYDLNRNSPSEIQASRTIVFKAEPSKTLISALQIGPDERIYTVYNDFLLVIEHPDELGGACKVERTDIKLSRGLGLPNMIDGWFDETHDHCLPPRARLRNSDTTICPGSCLAFDDLSADDPIRWRWSFEGAMPDTSTSRRPVGICYPDTGTFAVRLVVDNANGTDTAWGSVHVLAPTPIDAGADVSICLGDTAVVGAAIGTTGARSVGWTPVDGLDCPACAVTSASPRSTTTYVLHVVSEQGCESVDSVRVTVVPRPVAVAVSAGDSLCPGDSLQLHASGGTVYRWIPDPTLSCLDCTDPWVRPAATTTYRVAVSTGGACVDTAEVTVVVRNGSVVSVGPDTTICAGTAARLRASGAVMYRWSPDDGLSCGDCADPIARPSVTTTYRVESADSGGCIASASVTVRVVDPPEAAIVGDTMICRGGAATLTASGGSVYRWSPAEGVECASCSTTTVRPSRTTRYTVAVANDAGCTALATMVVRVDSSRVDVTGDTTICAGGSATLRATGGDGEYRWSPSEGLSCPECPVTEAHPSETTEYTVTTTSESGCAMRATVVVNVDRSSRALHISIPRTLRAYPGTTIEVPVYLDDDPEDAAVEGFELDVEYEKSMVRLRDVVAGSTKVEGWGIEVIEQRAGWSRIRFVGPPGEVLRGSGVLAVLRFGAFIGEVLGSEIVVRMTLPGRPCAEVMGDPGRVELDSICGLGFRLIESTGEGYALEQNHPNPFNPTTEIEFGVGLSGETRLEVLDALGRVVGRLVDGELSPGRYRVRWDASGYPSGLYYYRLRSGGWERTNTMLLVK